MVPVKRKRGYFLLLVAVAVCIPILLAAAGSRTAQHSVIPLTTLRMAFIEKEHVAEAIVVEKTFVENTTRLATEGTPWFTIKKGTTRILISAPHATHPTRHGKLRSCTDPGSGSLAEMLRRLADVTVIYTTYASPLEPNYYGDNDYKRALAQLIELL